MFVKHLALAAIALFVTASAHAATYNCQAKEWFSKEEGAVRIADNVGFSFKDVSLFDASSFCGASYNEGDCKVENYPGQGTVMYRVKCTGQAEDGLKVVARGHLSMSFVSGVGRFECATADQATRKLVEFNGCKAE